MGSLQEHHVRRNNTNDARSADLDVYCCVDLSWSSIQFVSASVHIENKVQWWGISKSDFSHYFFFLSLIPHFCRHRRLLIAAACVHRSLAAFIAVVRQKYAIRISLSFFFFLLELRRLSHVKPEYSVHIWIFIFRHELCRAFQCFFFFISFLFRHRLDLDYVRKTNESTQWTMHSMCLFECGAGSGRAPRVQPKLSSSIEMNFWASDAKRKISH